MNLAIVLARVPTARLKSSNGSTLVTSPFADLGSDLVDAEPSAWFAVSRLRLGQVHSVPLAGEALGFGESDCCY